MKKTLFCLILLVACTSAIAILSIREAWRLTSGHVLKPVSFDGFENFIKKKNTFESESLTGLEALYISVIVRDGRGVKEPVLIEEPLKVKVESKLREAGIKVLTKKESMATVDKAFLELTLTYHQRHKRDRPADYEYYLTLRFGQSVRPTRFVSKSELSDLEFDVVTWICKESGKCKHDLAIKSIQGTTQELVNEFLHDYLVANSKLEM